MFTFSTLRKEKLFVNLKKYVFLAFYVHFFRFIVSKDGLVADFDEVKGIREWLT